MALKTTQDEMPSLNLTPMIDTVFLLLIFFMAGTEFANMERGIGLKVPQVVDAGVLTPPPSRRVVSVYSDGGISLDRETVTIDELVARLESARSQYADLGVTVRGDAGGQFQRVAEVLNACKQAGIRDLGIAVRSRGVER